MAYPKQILPEGYVFPTSAPTPPVTSILTIHQATELNNWDLVEEILKDDKQQVHTKGWNGISPLHSACIRNHSKIVTILLEYGADPNAKSNYDETPLHYASRCGFVTNIQLLLKAGADVEIVDKQGRGCMHFATMGGSVAMVAYLEKATSLTVDSEDHNGETPLQYACIQHNVNMIHFLLNKNRSKIEHQNKKGETVIHMAAKHGNRELLWKLLTSSNCGVTSVEDNQGQTPMAIALKQNVNNINHTLIVRDLEGYMKQNKSLPPKGPTALWSVHLLFPFLWLSIVFFLCNFLNSHSGMFTLIAIGAMYVVIARQTHRISHVCKWPNPLFLGLFIGSVAHCVAIYFVKIAPRHTWNTSTYMTFIMLVTSSFIYVRHMYFLVMGDPGLIQRRDLLEVGKVFGGKQLSVLDIPSGRCKEEDFCPFSEIIRPTRSKYCRICGHVVMEMDHHCLYVNNCIAINNHYSFVIMLLSVMCMQVLLGKSMYDYLCVSHQWSTLQQLGGILLYNEAWMMGIVVVCLFAFGTEFFLIYVQFTNIANNQTSYFRNSAEIPSIKQQIFHVIRFFCKPKLRHVEREAKVPFMT